MAEARSPTRQSGCGQEGGVAISLCPFPQITEIAVTASAGTAKESRLSRDDGAHASFVVRRPHGGIPNGLRTLF